MSKVWLVWEVRAYGDQFVAGVFATESAAMTYCVAQADAEARRDPHSTASWEVEPRNVQGGAA